VFNGATPILAVEWIAGGGKMRGGGEVEIGEETEIGEEIEIGGETEIGEETEMILWRRDVRTNLMVVKCLCMVHKEMTYAP
jgi:UDP-3-O-[3-hydroxymyristoyl] glucosamine N-acyltransferase